jgi:hypothetical protein
MFIIGFVTAIGENGDCGGSSRRRRVFNGPMYYPICRTRGKAREARSRRTAHTIHKSAAAALPKEEPERRYRREKVRCPGEGIIPGMRFKAIAKRGRGGWKEDSGYHRRSLAENMKYRLKRLGIGCSRELSSVK